MQYQDNFSVPRETTLLDEATIYTKKCRTCNGKNGTQGNRSHQAILNIFVFPYIHKA
jgi:hypothetical protein